ncbi:hypothetical protein Acsp04_65170 [Actinomadura sp. NBRC 104425]|uniref:hypothetical protein n=1 Tax=Actinomadura sp. NBRC 104425 TaxID=3032204 RepID=UPI0024A0E97C|nr:hypothetical protein [Actinomadura sp. NBRC 104425]GLZ16282.1 hypothetical protein Acsp04_65170 [Actinomadura sp. NBRC 104425]
MSSGVSVLWLCGPPGVGKSSAAFEIFSQLSRAGVRAAFIDLDQIGLCHPVDDEHRVRIAALGAVWPNYRAAGVACLILSGVVDTAGQARAYADAMPGADVTLCRLRVHADELRRRFVGRGWRPELVDRAVAAADALDRTGFADLCVDTDGLTVPEVARTVRERIGPWPAAAPPPTAPPAAPAGAAITTPTLWLCGPVGVGKSTVGYEVFRQVIGDGVTAAYVDARQIGFLRSADDGHALKAANLAALDAVFRPAGAQCLIVSGETGHPDGYTGLFAASALTVCRLDAGPDRLAERVLMRGRGDGPVIPGDELRGLPEEELLKIARRAAAEAADASDGAVRVGTDDRSAADAARAVRAAAGGWPRLRAP